jgi:D-alanine-D-alanine ligase
VVAKTRVAVVMGGRSGEHDVSINSGNGVLANIDRGKYEVRKVVIGKDGAWSLDDGPAVGMLDALRALAPAIDVAFLALHGPNGEDGSMQGLFHLLGIPYTGSDYYASSLAMNKPRAKDVYRGAGLSVAADRLVRREDFQGRREDSRGGDSRGDSRGRREDSRGGDSRGDSRGRRAEILNEIAESIGFPAVVKTTKLGSSVGVDIVPDRERLESRIEEFFVHGAEVLVEQFIKGTELTAPVIDDPYQGRTVALPLIEIRPNLAGWFDYRSKYEKKGATEICPAPVDEETTRQGQEVGLLAHRALGCRGMSRTDMIVEPTGRIVVIETNTIPGFTQTSLLPQAAAQAGISYTQLVDLLVQEALGRGI